MLTSPFLLPALAVLASAAPKFQTINANYDDITVVPAVPALNTLDNYKGLAYTAFAANQVGVGGAAQVAGVAPHSGSNTIVTAIQRTAAAGSNAGFSVNGTNSKAFDLTSLYYGCSVDTVEGAGGVAQACTFNALGYRFVNDANPVASAELSFTPKATDLLAQPQKATFGYDFKLLQRIEFVQVESTSGSALNALIFDDVVYNLYT